MVVGAVIVGVITFFSTKNEKSDSPSDLAGFAVGNNSIYIAEQEPGASILVSVVRLEKPGFIVIHEDNVSEPGRILSVSNLIVAEEAKDLQLTSLSRSTIDGETLHAMLHIDNEDSTFNVEEDKPATDLTSGMPITMIFMIDKDAAKPGEINL